MRSRQRCFRSVKSATTYRNTIRAFLKACYLWASAEQREASYVDLDADVVAVLAVFRANVDGGDEVYESAVKVMCRRLLAVVRRKNDGYASCPIQCFLVGSLVTEEMGLPVLAANAQKVASALKYLFRGVEMLELHQEPAAEVGTTRKQLAESGLARFAGLVMLSKGIGGFKIDARQQVDVRPGYELVIDGADVGVSKLELICQTTERTCWQLLLGHDGNEGLLLGADIGSAEWTDAFPLLLQSDLGADVSRTVRLAWREDGAALGILRSDARSCALLKHAQQANKLKAYCTVGDGAHFKICKSTAIDYLRRCLRFEKEALSLLHVLGGCGNRATGEFESLYFRNTGTAMASSLTLVGDSSGMGEWLHIQGTSWKSSLLRGVNVAKSTLVPRKKMRALLAYWQIVRPFACGLLYPPDRGKSPGNVRSAVCWGRCGGPMRSAVCWCGR